MTPEDDPQLWNLLGKMPEPKVSPFFARNVVREVRQTSTIGAPSRKWFRLGRLIPISGLAAVLLVVAVVNRPIERTPKAKMSSAETAASTDGDDELLSDLDDVIAGDDSSSSVDSSIF